jgi:hypothetical protein
MTVVSSNGCVSSVCWTAVSSGGYDGGEQQRVNEQWLLDCGQQWRLQG